MAYTQKLLALFYVFQIIIANETRLNRTNHILWSESRPNSKCGNDINCFVHTMCKLRSWTEGLFSSLHDRSVSAKILWYENRRHSIGVARIFDWVVMVNHKLHAITSLEIFDRGTFLGTLIS